MNKSRMDNILSGSEYEYSWGNKSPLFRSFYTFDASIHPLYKLHAVYHETEIKSPRLALSRKQVVIPLPSLQDITGFNKTVGRTILKPENICFARHAATILNYNLTTDSLYNFVRYLKSIKGTAENSYKWKHYVEQALGATQWTVEYLRYATNLKPERSIYPALAPKGYRIKLTTGLLEHENLKQFGLYWNTIKGFNSSLNDASYIEIIDVEYKKGKLAYIISLEYEDENIVKKVSPEAFSRVIYTLGYKPSVFEIFEFIWNLIENPRQKLRAVIHMSRLLFGTGQKKYGLEFVPCGKLHRMILRTGDENEEHIGRILPTS
jgi:hypothetical protein